MAQLEHRPPAAAEELLLARIRELLAQLKGEVSDDGTLLGMNFYVEGVDDKLPQ